MWPEDGGVGFLHGFKAAGSLWVHLLADRLPSLTCQLRARATKEFLFANKQQLC